MDGQFRFALATQDSTTWKLDDAPEPNPLITYSLGPKQVTVYLQCSDSTTPLFTAVGEVSTNAYVFRLSHKCACWNGCKSRVPENITRMSRVHSCFCIIFRFSETIRRRWRWWSEWWCRISHHFGSCTGYLLRFLCNFLPRSLSKDGCRFDCPSRILGRDSRLCQRWSVLHLSPRFW